MVKIRELLDDLAEMSRDSIDRLCEKRDIQARSIDAKCEALARSYRRDHELFFQDLRKEDLVWLFKLPPSYTKDELIELALKEVWDEETLDEDLDDFEGYDGEPEEDIEEQIYYRTEEYERFFRSEISYSQRAAARPLREYQNRAVEVLMRALEPTRPKLLHLATGGGKTRVANTVVSRLIAERGAPVLWVTKDWRLLLQAVRDYGQRHPRARLSRIGGDGTVLHPLPERTSADVVYTTVQTLYRRLPRRILKEIQPELLVWDECHWGEHGKVGRVLKACGKAGIPVLGLTATPRSESKYDVAYSKTFQELVNEGVLARPNVQTPVRTGVRWSPQLSRGVNDVTRASLRELAENRRRNACIVDHYIANAHLYGKTIVFACNVDHADLLANMFVRRGIAARVMHSKQFDGLNQQALEEFRSNAVQVLVNVEMLTHGVDVPDALTVFLCRPTTSDILFAQMVGRASRRDDSIGKTSFFVVEFTDNVTEHADLFTTAQRYFTGSSGAEQPRATRTYQSPSGTRVREHKFDPAGAPTWVPDDVNLPESVRGLWYREGQTFGIEFELTTLDGRVPPLNERWRDVAEKLRLRLAEALPGLVAPRVLDGYVGSEGDKDMSVWNVEYDSSAGWEVTTRVLVNRTGLSRSMQGAVRWMRLQRNSDCVSPTEPERTSTSAGSVAMSGR